MTALPALLMGLLLSIQLWTCGSHISAQWDCVQGEHIVSLPDEGLLMKLCVDPLPLLLSSFFLTVGDEDFPTYLLSLHIWERMASDFCFVHCNLNCEADLATVSSYLLLPGWLLNGPRQVKLFWCPLSWWFNIHDNNMFLLRTLTVI